MRLNCKHAAKIQNGMKINRVDGDLFATVVLSSKLDRAQFEKRFHPELAATVWGALHEAAQKNLPTEENEHDLYWMIKPFQPDITFEDHALNIDGMTFAVKPKFDKIVPISGEPKVEVHLRCQCKMDAAEAAKLPALTGASVSIQWVPLPPAAQSEDPQAVGRNKKGSWGHEQPTSA